jgi:putative pyruvate formate lyase activating enzyme
MQFLATEVFPNTYINIMGQYHPDWRADSFPKLKRSITKREHEEALQIAREAGLYRGDRLN